MGFLCTFTLRNDALDELDKDPKGFVKKLKLAAVAGKVDSIAHGSHANMVEVQKCRHMDDKTVYVHAGNTLCEMSSWSDDTEHLMKNFPQFFEEMLHEMEYHTRELKKKYKQYKRDN